MDPIQAGRKAKQSLTPSDIVFARFVTGKESYWFLAILCLAAALYLHNLGYSDIWGDEALTKAISRHPLPELLRLVAHDAHPPLYFVGLKLFTPVVGNGDYAIRLFSVLGALSTMGLCYAMGRRLFGPAGALCLCLVLLALPMPGQYARMARMYTWAGFVTTGTFFCAALYARDRRKHDLALLGLFCLMAVYTHYYCLFAAFWSAMALLVWFWRKRDPAWRSVAAMGVLVLLLFLPWMSVLYSQARMVRQDFWIPPASWSMLLTCYTQPFGGFFWPYPLTYTLAGIFGALTLVSIWQGFASRNRATAFPLGLSLVVFNGTLLTAAVVSHLFKPILYFRYVMTVAPLLAIAPMLALVGWRRSWLRAMVLAGALGCGAYIVTAESNFSFGPYQQAIQRLAKTHPEVKKVLHLSEHTASPFAEYGRGGSWDQAYLRNAGSSWYSNMEAMDGLTPIQDLNDWVKPGEVFCMVIFEGVPLNMANLDLVLNQCRTIAVEEVADGKPYPGIKLKLYVLARNG